MQEVFFNKDTNEISFNYVKNKSVLFGETDGTLEDFLKFMKEDWKNKNLNLLNLPKIERK